MCIAKAMYLEKLERLIIWDGLSNCFTFFFKKFWTRMHSTMGTKACKVPMAHLN